MTSLGLLIVTQISQINTDFHTVTFVTQIPQIKVTALQSVKSVSSV